MKTTTKSKLNAQLEDFSKLNYQLLIEKQELIKKCKYRIIGTIVLFTICVFLTQIALKLIYLVYLLIKYFPDNSEYYISALKVITLTFIFITGLSISIVIFINEMYTYITEW